ncbi:CCA tRNA nucleotidyltransferase [Archangium primigenium]|uniref:CCA tRNA nucleotidyltransferase n=1 Tax=[Archangium] primigenium TaxID=2792470 RepID=UPI001EF94401|nr:[cytidine(C)-cytidine(C)-adenosine (A)]-adding enzyme [Archangium primigenium]
MPASRRAMIPPPTALIEAPVPAPIREVVARLRELNHAVYLVGGCVRDILRGVPPKDFDVATSAFPEEVQKAFRKVIPTGLQHGTVTVLAGQEHVEVTTFRSEGDYHDGRRPNTVTFERDITKDLSRRDFTINAMAWDPLGLQFVDPFGGRHDLDARLIRCVGSALARFSEDGLRPLRAVRFAAVLGFTLDAETQAAIPQTLPVFRKVSLERVREEFVKLLMSPRAEMGLELLASTGLLEVFLPELAGVDAEAARLARATAAAAPAELEVRLAALLADVVDGAGAEAICVRLKFPTKVAERVRLLVSLAALEQHLESEPPALRRLLARVGPAQLEALLEVARARFEVRLASRRGDFERLQARLRDVAAGKPPLSPKELALNGGAIMAALGVGPSPLVGQATRFLMEWVLDEPSRNTAESLREALEAWKKTQGA